MSIQTPESSVISFSSRTIPNTLALPCVADSAFILDDESFLPALQSSLKPGQSYKVIGSASNLVLPEHLHDRVILVALEGIEVVKEDGASILVAVAAGQLWHEWVETALAAGWHGLENLALIPGTVGAAPVQNVGAYGVEVSEIIDHVRVWDFEQGAIRHLSALDCQFAYRDSLFKQPQARHLLILTVCFRLAKRQVWQPTVNYPDLKSLVQDSDVNGDVMNSGNITPQMVFDRVVAVRRHKLPDPKEIPNVGSFFKNPVVTQATLESLKHHHPELVAYAQPDGRHKLAAGWLIDQCGWKGQMMGAVGMHHRQALVLINVNAGRLADVVELANAVQTDVFEAFGVSLEIEPSCWV